MAKPRTIHACQACGAQHSRWHGRCPDCGAWDSLVEETFAAPRAAAAAGRGRGAREPGRRAGRRREAAAALARSTATRARGSRPASTSSIACSAAASCPARSCCSAAIPGSGSRRSRSSSRDGSPRRGARSSTSAAKRAPSRSSSGRSGSPGLGGSLQILTRRASSRWPHRSRDLAPSSSSSTRSRRSRPNASSRRRARSRRCASRAAQLAATAKRLGAVLLLIGHVTKDGHARRAAGARASGRRRADLRGRPRPRVPPAARGQEPLRLDPGDRRLPDGGAGARAGRESERALPRGAQHRAHRAAASCRCSKARGRCWSSCRRWSRRRPTARRAARPSASTMRGSRCCSPCSIAASPVDLLSQDVYANATGGVRVAEPAADLAHRARDRVEPARARAAAGHGGDRRDRARRRAAPRSRVDVRVAEAARLGFERILVPAVWSASGAPGSPGSGARRSRMRTDSH